MNKTVRRGTAVVALALAGVALSQSPAVGTPGPTPNEGLTGACNMTSTHAAFGMFERAVQDGPGLDGMIGAIINSGGDCFE